MRQTEEKANEIFSTFLHKRCAFRENINESEDVQTLKNHLYLEAKKVFVIYINPRKELHQNIYIL